VLQRHDAPFLIWLDNGGRTVSWTYGEFDAVVDEVAAGLRALGVQPGGAVHLALTSCPAFVAIWLAVTKIGAWMVPSDPMASAPELAGHLRRTRSVVGVCAMSRRDAYLTAVGELDTADRPAVIIIDEADTDLDELRVSGAIDLAHRPTPIDRLAVMFTSGTTSAPKGVELTQANYAFAGDIMASAASLRCDDRFLVVLPLFHANAQYYSFAASISAGASVALVGSFSASRFRRQAAKLGATHASLFAAPIRMILARDDGQSIHDLQLRHVWFAQNLTAEHYVEFARLVGCRPQQLYGMTETLPAVVTQRALDACNDVMGHQTLGCSVEVVDPHTGEPAAVGEVGDLVVFGRPGTSLFAGYLDDPVTTEASILSRGTDGNVAFRTGDRATVDETGALRFGGRSAEVLKVAGENVAVVEVEGVLAEHPQVFEVAVVGEADPIRDEIPVAYVVPVPGQSIDPEDLLEWARERLAPAKRPRAVHLVNELPRTSVGKIRKFMLRSPTQNDPK
jgi:crotonobetaine/carnitine-CoA ligase